MGFKIGFLRSGGGGLKIISDATKVDIIDDESYESSRGGTGSNWSTRQSAKARILIELDHISQVTVGNSLWKVLNNRDFPHKVYIHEPADSSQEIDYAGITNPSSTHIIKQASTDNPNLSIISPAVTEFSTANYTAIGNFSTGVSISAVKDYQVWFFDFDISNFISAFGIQYIRRLTLFLQDLEVYRNNSNKDKMGYLVQAYNFIQDEWIEIKRQEITVNATNQQFASLRPIEGFTDFSEFIDGSNKIRFKIRNLQNANPIIGLTFALKYIKLLINGFGVVKSNDGNFNWRDPYTGMGYVGTIGLDEL